VALLVACASGGSSPDVNTDFASPSGDAGAVAEAGAGDDGRGSVDVSASSEGASDDAASASVSGGDDGSETGDAGADPVDSGGSADAVGQTDSADKCALYGDSCGDCTKGRSGYNCGWCNGCFTGTSSGPTSAGACAATTWVWKSGDCP